MKKITSMLVPLAMATSMAPATAPATAQTVIEPAVAATPPDAAPSEPAERAAASDDQAGADSTERTAIASRIVDITLPVGSFAQIWAAMSGDADPASLGDVAENDKDSRRAAHEARTGRPVTGTTREAEESSLSEMISRMGALMEPLLRDAMIRVYARRYSAVQLRELESFFQTPTGTAFARDSLTMMNQPEVRSAMQEATADMIGVVASEFSADAMMKQWTPQKPNDPDENRDALACPPHG